MLLRCESLEPPISLEGHGETNTTRAQLVCTASVSGIYFPSQTLPGGATTGLMQCSKRRTQLFDHLVGAQQERWCNRHSESARCLEVNH
jgi:hypothetical protein